MMTGKYGRKKNDFLPGNSFKGLIDRELKNLIDRELKKIVDSVSMAVYNGLV